MSCTDFRPRITIIGVGGGGASAVDAMITADLRDVDSVVVDTDPWELIHSPAAHRIQLDPIIHTGSVDDVDAEIGRLAAEKAVDDIKGHLDGVHLVFLVAGMGGSTGTGATPVIASAAAELGILTVGVVTSPFAFEGSERARVAEEGITDLQQFVDTLIVIPANRLLGSLQHERMTQRESFERLDHALYRGVSGVTDLLLKIPNIGIDFADVRSVLANMGKATIGHGEASGEKRAIWAAEQVLTDPLLAGIDLSEMGGLLMSFVSGSDLTLFEVDEAATRIRREFNGDATVIFGWSRDKDMEGTIRISTTVVGWRPA